jgi:hypothetical protein
MSEPIKEYTVRNFSAVDEQVKQIAERERVLTNKLKLANLRQACLIGGIGLLVFGAFLILAAWAYRIAFPAEQQIIEKTEIIEKTIEPQKIIIQTPAGSIITDKNVATETSTTGLPPNAWGKNPTDNNTSSTDKQLEVVPNIENAKQEPSAIGTRKVTTFTNVRSGIIGFNNVVTGWIWADVTSKEPGSQYCYIERLSRDKIKTNVDLATKQSARSAPKDLYESTTANAAELSRKNWVSAMNKCRWF